MASQLARLMGAHSLNMRRPDPMAGAVGSGMMVRDRLDQRKANRAQVELNAIETQRKNRLQDAQESRASAKERRDASEFATEEQNAQIEKMIGPVMAAKDQATWNKYQADGWIPKDLGFEQKEPITMYYLSEKNRQERQKHALDLSKHAEDKRSNRATEATARMNASKSGSGGAGAEAADIQKVKFLTGIGMDRKAAADLVFSSKGKTPMDVHAAVFQAVLRNSYGDNEEAQEVADKYVAGMFGEGWNKRVSPSAAAPNKSNPLGWPGM